MGLREGNGEFGVYIYIYSGAWVRACLYVAFPAACLAGKCGLDIRVLGFYFHLKKKKSNIRVLIKHLRRSLILAECFVVPKVCGIELISVSPCVAAGGLHFSRALPAWCFGVK